MKIYKFNNNYTLEKDYKNGFDYETTKELITDYFDDYDYILGDWSYGKLRLKGFCDKTNKKYKKINSIEIVDEYIKKHCAYDCKYFILKKVEENKDKQS